MREPPRRPSADFSAKSLQARSKRYNIFKCWKKKLPTKITMQNWKREKEFSRQVKAKGVPHHETSLIRNVKGAPLCLKVRALIGKGKHESKNLTSEEKYIVKVVD